MSLGIESLSSFTWQGVLHGAVAYASGRPSPKAALLHYGVTRAAVVAIFKLGNTLARACAEGNDFCVNKNIYAVMAMVPGLSAYGNISDLSAEAAELLGEDCNSPWVVASSILIVGTPIIALFGSFYIGKKVVNAFHLSMSVDEMCRMHVLTNMVSPIASQLVQQVLGHGDIYDDIDKFINVK